MYKSQQENISQKKIFVKFCSNYITFSFSFKNTIWSIKKNCKVLYVANQRQYTFKTTSIIMKKIPKDHKAEHYNRDR